MLTGLAGGDKLNRVEPRVDSLWSGDFSSLKPSDFGSKEWHGRFHPEIVAQGVLRYLPEGGTVWDPMSGGGTTGDVCKLFEGVTCIQTDLHPSRPTIEPLDASMGPLQALTVNGLRPRSVDLLVLHPPYWKAVSYGSAMDEAPGVEDFCAEFGKVLQTCVPFLKDKGHAVLVIGNYYEKGKLNLLDLPLIDKMLEWGFIVKGRIAKDFGETKAGHLGKGRALWKYRALKHGFWEYGWEQVFYLQLRR